MDGTLSPILADKFGARLGTASTLIALNVSRRNGRMIVSAATGDLASDANGVTVRGQTSRLS
jgi:hypothetical protein